MEEKTVREILHEAVGDMVQWVQESPTEGVRQERIRLVMDAVSGRRLQLPWQSMETSHHEWIIDEEVRPQ